MALQQTLIDGGSGVSVRANGIWVGFFLVARSRKDCENAVGMGMFRSGLRKEGKREKGGRHPAVCTALPFCTPCSCSCFAGNPARDGVWLATEWGMGMEEGRGEDTCTAVRII